MKITEEQALALYQLTNELMTVIGRDGEITVTSQSYLANE